MKITKTTAKTTKGAKYYTQRAKARNIVRGVAKKSTRKK